MKDDLPAIVTLFSEASTAEQYDNHALANVNDHVVRISVMTHIAASLSSSCLHQQLYGWRHH